MKRLNKEWFQAAFVRAIKTVAQTMLSLITVGAAFSEINWIYILSVSLVSGIASILTSIAGLPEATCDGEVSVDNYGRLHGDVAVDSIGNKKTVRLKLK